MTAPRQMTAKTLNALKGWPQQSAVDFNTSMSASVVKDPVLPGTVVRLNAATQFELGVGTRAVMPLFTFIASDDPDVVNDGGDPAVDDGVFIGIGQTGGLMALVAIGAYELTSTEYVAGVSYAPNDHLTSSDDNTTGGKLAKGTRYAQTIVGVVSRGLVDNGYGKTALAFWPYYLPANV